LKKKIKIKQTNDILEVNYFEDIDDYRYRLWRVPISVAKNITEWTSEIEGKVLELPIKNVRLKDSEIILYTGKSIYVKKVDEKYGYYEIIGWDMPVEILQAIKEMINDNLMEIEKII